MKIEQINDAKIAVADYADRKAEALANLESILNTWHFIQAECPDHIVAIVAEQDDDYLQLENSDAIWRTYEKYNRRDSRRYDHTVCSLRRLLTLTAAVERAITALPTQLAKNAIRFDVS